MLADDNDDDDDDRYCPSILFAIYTYVPACIFLFVACLSEQRFEKHTHTHAHAHTTQSAPERAHSNVRVVHHGRASSYDDAVTAAGGARWHNLKCNHAIDFSVITVADL